MRLILLLLVIACGARTDLPAPSSSSDDASVDVGGDDGGFDTGRDTGLPDAGFDAGFDAAPPPCRVPAPVDLLLVIDDSGSMEEEQRNLASNLPRLVADLVEPPDADGDGRPDWRAPRDLHFGVVTTEVAPTCGFDADGILRDRPGSREDCADSYPRFLTFSRGDDVDAVSRDFACLAQAGVMGCAIEQPLEAALKALLPSDAPFETLGTRPHGDAENRGFLRDDSMLTVLFLTDEDDCSTFDPETILSSEFIRGELPPCLREDDPLYDLDRYERAFRSLRPERPDLFTFVAIAGFPESVIDDPAAVDFERLLGHSRMQYRIDPIEPLLGVVPACRGRGGSGFPARRLAQLAQRFEGQSALESICRTTFLEAVGSIARQVGLRACEEFE